MALNREEIEQIARSTAQAVLEGLHRYAVDYKEPESIEQGLQDSMIEERTAADWYRKRAKNAAEQAVFSVETLYKSIAVDEDEHYDRFKAMLDTLAKEDAAQREIKTVREGPEEVGSLYQPPDPRAKKCDYPGCDKWARYYGKDGGVTRYLCTHHFKEVYNVPNW